MWAIAITFRPSSDRPLTFHILIFSSETTGPIATKLWWNGPWMAPYQYCVRWSRFPTKMAAKLKNRKKGGWNLKKIFSSETTEPISTKLCWNDPWVVPFKIVYGISDLRPRWPPQPKLTLHRTLWEIPIKIFLPETICSIRTKFWWNSHWMVLFQKCVRPFDQDGPNSRT